ncbi:MAG: hypothetical protein HKN43_16890 [Rhodothermales bacterium]|nr:hypothetical protein [Rhodothermales bacterium]
MFDHPVVFSWPGIFLGAIVFGFLFEMLFVLSDNVIEPGTGLTIYSMGFGLLAAIAYVGAGAYVRRQRRHNSN